MSETTRLSEWVFRSAICLDVYMCVGVCTSSSRFRIRFAKFDESAASQTLVMRSSSHLYVYSDCALSLFEYKPFSNLCECNKLLEPTYINENVS